MVESKIKLTKSKGDFYREYNLPFGWIKKCSKRKRGKSAGYWDITLTSPDKTKLRSNRELKTFLQSYPDVKCDIAVTDTYKFYICPICDLSSDEEGNWIKCDGELCPEWYHWGCVGLTEVPEGDWFCPKCLGIEQPKGIVYVHSQLKNTFLPLLLSSIVYLR